MTCISGCNEYLPLRTIPVVVRNGIKSLSINALLDDGSTRSLINEDISDWLGLIGEPVSLNVRLLNDQTASLRSQSVQFGLKSCDGRVKKTVTAQTMKRIIDMHAVNWVVEKKWPHLININFPLLGRHPIIDMLLGMDLADLHCLLKEVKRNPGEPITRLTPLEWALVHPKTTQNVKSTTYRSL